MKNTYVPKALFERFKDIVGAPKMGAVEILSSSIKNIYIAIPAYAVSGKQLRLLSAAVSVDGGEPLSAVFDVTNAKGAPVQMWSAVRNVEFSFNERHAITPLQSKIMDFAEELSLRTHVIVCVSGESQYGRLVPPRDDKYVVVLSGCGMGDCLLISAAQVFGIGLEKDLEEEVTFQGPVVGRGVVHVDEAGTPVAQTIGGESYIFFSMAHCHDKEKLTIIYLAMALAWNDRVNGKKPALRERDVISSANSDTLVTMLEVARRTRIQTAVHAASVSLERRKTELREAVRQLDFVRTLEKAYKDESAAVLPRREASLRELLAHPLVEEVCGVEDGIELTTREVIIVHNNVSYKVGTFVVRFNQDGDMSLWARTTHHPHGVMHPHIGRTTAVCFGNITVSIEEKIARHDFSGAALLVLRWLTDGYLPESADTPITKWPIVVVPTLSEMGEGKIHDEVAA